MRNDIAIQLAVVEEGVYRVVGHDEDSRNREHSFAAERRQFLQGKNMYGYNRVEMVVLDIVP